ATTLCARKLLQHTAQSIDADLPTGSSSRNAKETPMTPRLYIGTAGLSVWYSDDLGETLQRFWGASGLYSETRVWALSAHPERPGELLAGTDSGIYRLDTASGKWIHLPSEM